MGCDAAAPLQLDVAVACYVLVCSFASLGAPYTILIFHRCRYMLALTIGFDKLPPLEVRHTAFRAGGAQHPTQSSHNVVHVSCKM